MKARKRVLLAKVETTYGVDSNPTGAANAIVTKNLKVKNYEGTKIQRGIDRPTLGNDEEINVGPHTTVNFEVELAGSGTAGVAPAFGPLLRACAHSETVTALTDTRYKLVSEGEESATLYVHIDKQLHVVPGARGTVDYGVNSENTPVMTFSFTGLHAKPVTGSLPVANYSAFVKPLPVTKVNTPTYTVHEHPAVAEAFSINIAHEVKYRNVVNSESVEIVDRSPSGALTIEAPDLVVKDFYQIVEDRTLGLVNIVHGVTAGNIVEFVVPQAQLLSPDLDDSSGIGTLKMNINLLPTDAGDDEFELIIR